MSNRHRLERISEGGTTFTTHLIAVIVNREHTAQFSMATTEREIQDIHKPLGDAIPQRSIF
jgi:hypothetical protein